LPPPRRSAKSFFVFNDEDDDEDGDDDRCTNALFKPILRGKKGVAEPLAEFTAKAARAIIFNSIRMVMD
jgi:hypothetical protein